MFVDNFVKLATRTLKSSKLIGQSAHRIFNLSHIRDHRSSRNLCSSMIRPSNNVVGNGPATVSFQRLENRSVICASGTDVMTFLQGYVTNDVQLLEAGSAMYAMMLNVQGRIMYDLFLYRLRTDSPTVLIECQHDATSDLISTLLRYKLRKKIDIRDAGKDYDVWSVFSESVDMTDVSVHSKDSLFCLSDPRHASFGFRLLMPSDATACPVVDRHSVSEGNYDQWRCVTGVGEGTVDFPPGQSFPLEANLAFMNGVSFSKGCYIGQELTARTNYTGVIRKRIMPLILLSSPEKVKPGSSVVNASGKDCGKVRTVCGQKALALLRIDDVVGKGVLEIREDETKLAEAITAVPSWWPTSSDAVVQKAVAKTAETDAINS